jgi:class 3 adenylate cyclase
VLTPHIQITVENPSDDALDGERKTVTALFADIKGSMELIEELDPEEARAIIDPALKLMIDAVHRYQGCPPATAFSHCSAHRWPMRTIPKALSMWFSESKMIWALWQHMRT